MNLYFDVIIIGAGASGFCCAVSALAQQKTVAILEHNNFPLKKVKISGGGRCNFTNLNTKTHNYLTNSDTADLIKNTLEEFSPKDFIKLTKKHRIEVAEKNSGQLFTTTSSQDIINMLLLEAKKAQIFYNKEVKNIKKENNTFFIQTNKEEFSCKSVVIATGGLSYQTMGASDFGYKIAKQFGLKIIPYKPALVPFNLSYDIMKDIVKLKGVSLKAIVNCNGKKFKDNILFTHFGISGPAVLQSSLYWSTGVKVSINMLPDIEISEELKKLRDNSKGKKISNIIGKYLPNKLVEYLVGEKDCFVSEASNKTIETLAKKINNWGIVPIGTQGYKLAEVTSGGIDLNEITNTFETKKIKNLFFIGEVLDVTGQLGGYNLQWAWSSGFIAGKHV